MVRCYLPWSWMQQDLVLRALLTKNIIGLSKRIWYSRTAYGTLTAQPMKIALCSGGASVLGHGAQDKNTGSHPICCTTSTPDRFTHELGPALPSKWCNMNSHHVTRNSHRQLTLPIHTHQKRELHLLRHCTDNNTTHRLPPCTQANLPFSSLLLHYSKPYA